VVWRVPGACGISLLETLRSQEQEQELSRSLVRSQRVRDSVGGRTRLLGRGRSSNPSLCLRFGTSIYHQLQNIDRFGAPGTLALGGPTREG
jgi:hypothetical protein